MAADSQLLTVSFVLEQDGVSFADRSEGDLSESEIIDAVVTAINQLHDGRDNIRVQWRSTGIISLDDYQSRGLCGRCAQCDKWVYDVENVTDQTPTGLSKGAYVNDELLCDDCLPKDHPVAF